MAVTIDVGEANDLHPQNKKTVGERLALCAQFLAYQENSIIYSGPLIKEVQRKNGALHLWFEHIAHGLVCMGDSLQTFMICGKDEHFLPAKAFIDGDCVVVFHEHIRHPLHVRYFNHFFVMFIHTTFCALLLF